MVTNQPRTLKVVNRREVTIIALDVVFMQAMYSSWTTFKSKFCQDNVLKGVIGRRNSVNRKSKPLRNLKKQDLIHELASRGMFQGDTKKELEDNLTNELQGVQRVPALLFENPTKDLKAINIEHYEILVCEPMHDVSKHIENLLIGLPSHIANAERKKLVEETIALTIGGKETKRAFDYRCDNNNNLY